MPTLRDYFDAIYVINLPDRTDRRAEMEEQLQRIGLAFDSCKVILFAASKPADRGDFESIGARGCFLSHLRILEHAQEHSLSRILICEDDLNFCDGFSPRMQRVLNGLASRPWGLFYGGYRAAAGPIIGDANELWSIPPHVPIQTTHFVGVQRPAIAGLATMFKIFLNRRAGDPNGGPMHVDGAYSWYRASNPEEVTLAAVPQLGYQRSSRTDVAPLGWADRTPLVRNAVAQLRRLRNRVRDG